ncbi:YciI family protein [Micrococcus endophyticus]|uniref:YciI family protein n=1 Tax=Micrococcus endophyticus TaxID=455343 RepID=UPI0034CE6614
MIETFDDPAVAHLRQERLQEHLAFLEENRERLLACGAKTDDDLTAGDGGLYLLDTDSRAEAEAFIAEDPFSRAGLFQRVHVQRWRMAYLDGRNRLRG